MKTSAPWVLCITLLAGAAYAEQKASDPIQLRFDYAGARTLFEALDRPALSQKDIIALYDVQGLAGMVDNVTRFIPAVTRREFEQHLLAFREKGKEPGHDGHIIWDFKQVQATRGEVEGLIGKLSANEATIIPQTLRKLELLQPQTGPLAITVYFVAGGVSDGFVPERSSAPALYVNLTRAQGDLDGVVSNLTHEIYHVMQQTASRRAGMTAMIDEPEKLEPVRRLLANTLWEGSANYAADPRQLAGSGPYLTMWRDRFAQHTKPARVAKDFALFETVLNDLQAGRMSWDDAYARGFSGPENAFYFVGYEMTRVIDQHCGRQCVRQLFAKTPADFFRRYIEIYQRDPKIKVRFSSATEALIAAAR
jgi:hypothetical protein